MHEKGVIGMGLIRDLKNVNGNEQGGVTNSGARSREVLLSTDLNGLERRVGRWLGGISGLWQKNPCSRQEGSWGVSTPTVLPSHHLLCDQELNVQT